MRRTVATALLTASALLLAGCAGSGATDTSGPTALASVIDTSVQLVSAGSTSKLTDSTQVVAGDHVVTDSAGLAEITYADDSLTRVGPGSDLTITELSSADAQRTTVSLDVGVTFHRVQKLIAEDAQFEVKTPVGVAAVHGTAFAVECVEGPACVITVLEGEVDFTLTDGTEVPLGVNQSVTVPNEDGGEPVVVDVSAKDLSAWVTANATGDGGVLPSAGPVFTKAFAPCPPEPAGSTRVIVPDAYAAGMPSFLPVPSCTHLLGATSKNPFTWAFLVGGTSADLDAIAAVAMANGYEGYKYVSESPPREGVSSEDWNLDGPDGETLELALIEMDPLWRVSVIIVDWGAP
jgi:hypothetical protein